MITPSSESWRMRFLNAFSLTPLTFRVVLAALVDMRGFVTEERHRVASGPGVIVMDPDRVAARGGRFSRRTRTTPSSGLVNSQNGRRNMNE